MFSTLPVLVHNFRSTAYYAPQVPSPLSSSPVQSSSPSPRDGNAPWLPMSPPTLNKTRKASPYSKRITFSNPLIHKHSDGREARRKLFLKKVQKDSQNRRWDARGGDDEMMRTIWIAEQRRQTERKAREAMTYFVSVSQEEELESDLGKQTSLGHFQSSEDVAMADEVARYEDAEIEAALSSFPAEENSQSYYPYESLETPYCSDDEEYDKIFSEVIEEAERNTEIKEDDRVFPQYLNGEENRDRKHKSVDTSKADIDMMDMT